MTNSQRLATVRAFLRNWIAEATSQQESLKTSSDGEESVADWTESMLIREGFFCGRSFVVESHRAVWFIEEDELKIRDQSGEVVAVFRGAEITSEDSVETSDSDDVVEPTVIKIETDDSDDTPIRRAA